MAKKDKNKVLKNLFQKIGRQVYILKHVTEWEYCQVGSDAFAVIMINPNLGKEYKKTALFGFISFPDDFSIAKKLFDKIEGAAKKYSAEKIIGPVNYSTWFEYRWKIDGFSEPQLYPDPSNQVYMPDFAKKLGYSEFKFYDSGLVKTDDGNLEMYKKRYDQASSEGYIFKRYEGFRILFALKDLYEVSLDAFSENVLYSPISYKMFKKIYVSGFNKSEKTHPIVDICYFKKTPVGFIFTYKNPYSDDLLIWKTVAIKKSYRQKGLGSALRHIAHKTALENNCDFLLHHLSYEENVVKKLRGGSSKILKRYALFVKEI